ncbi:TonB-dependent receptor [Flammeovirgaceae bacterium SG7u.111]|nr:TonB-dependent receptor [Flammeovirgaceae bacterium SG7u.132]WPO35993.1 TonB-dependent receptor [Flammeovirgaceae bacterium SG7u.111]
MRRITAFLMLFFASLFSLAQGFTVKGKVADEIGDPLPFVNVVLFSEGGQVKGTATNENGFFTLQVGEGDYLLKASFIGLETIEKQFSLSEDTDLGTVVMKSGALQLEGVEIVGTPTYFTVEPGKMTVDVENSALDGESSVADVLNNIPSVTVDDENNIMIRGSSPVILIDGVRSNLSSIAGDLPAGMIAEIEVVTNPSAKYDGRGGNGVINIKLKKEKRKGTNGFVEVGAGSEGLINTNGMVNRTLGKFRVFAGVNFQHNEINQVSDVERKNLRVDYTSQVFQQSRNTRKLNNVVLTSGMAYTPNKFNQLNLNLKYLNKPLANNLFLEDSSFREDELRSFSDADYAYDILTENIDASISYNRKWDKKERKFLAVADVSTGNYTYFREGLQQLYNKNTFEKLDYLRYRRNGKDDGFTKFGFKADFEDKLGEVLAWEAGYFFEYNRSSSSTDAFQVKKYYPAAPETSQDTLYNLSQFHSTDVTNAGYLQLNKTVGKVHVNGGIRMELILADYNVNDSVDYQRNYTNYIPTAAISYTFSEHKSLNFSYSQRVKLPNMRQLNPANTSLSPYSFHFGNPGLVPEKLQNYELTYNYGKDDFDTYASVFYKENLGIIDQDYVYIDNEDTYDIMTYRYENLADLSLVGAEVFLSGKMFKEKLSAKMTLSGFHQSATHLLGKELPFSEELIGNGKLNLDYKLKKGVNLQSVVFYNSSVFTVFNEKGCRYGLNVYVKKSFKKQKLTVQLRAVNVLRNPLYTNHRVQPGNIDNFSQYDPNNRYLYVSLRKRFVHFKG